ncbi:MAG: hypothetical protein GWP63_07495 [Haliea sp.]|jgi:hypothetical protein|nr:hypothetical protein [Haliea sp.]
MKRVITHRSNFVWLLIALLFLLFSDAMFAQLDSHQGQRLINITLMLTIVAAVWSVETSQGRWLNWKLGMTFIIAALMIGDSIIESNFLAIYQLTSSFIFLMFSLLLCWRQVMFSGTIDTNKVIGAICIYILIGLIWSFGYLIVEHLFPGSFKGLEDSLWQHNLEELIYYSLVTLTTLGYGDITPQQPLAQFLAYMEAITGIFYTTVLVASLIGMRLAHYSEGISQKTRGE